jgi:serine/threonine protein kinase
MANRISNYYGITQDLDTQDFMIIMPHYNSGDLMHYISSDFYSIKWVVKLVNLETIAEGLINIHSVDIIHRDLHSGNIFFQYKFPYIGDLGISKSATESTDNKENYGIIPYMAPEIFQGQKYTKASDIYSFGMIMWEFMTGRRPFWDRNHDIELIIDICDGLRPPIVANAPEGYIELMKGCWHSDPDKRPTAIGIYRKVHEMRWEEWSNRNNNNPTKIMRSLDIGPVKINHSGAIYKSRPLSGMINSAMSLRSLRSQSIDFKKVKRKFEINNGVVSIQLQIKFNL